MLRTGKSRETERQEVVGGWGEGGIRGAAKGHKDENVLKWAMGMAAQLREHTQAAELHASNG